MSSNIPIHDLDLLDQGGLLGTHSIGHGEADRYASSICIHREASPNHTGGRSGDRTPWVRIHIPISTGWSALTYTSASPDADPLVHQASPQIGCSILGDRHPQGGSAGRSTANQKRGLAGVPFELENVLLTHQPVPMNAQKLAPEGGRDRVQ